MTMSEKLARLLDLESQRGGGIDISSVKKEYNDIKMEITNDLDKVYACGNLINQVNDLLNENTQLKEERDMLKSAFCDSHAEKNIEIKQLKERLTISDKMLMNLDKTLRTRAINYKRDGHHEVYENTLSLYNIIFGREM